MPRGAVQLGLDVDPAGEDESVEPVEDPGDAVGIPDERAEPVRPLDRRVVTRIGL